MSRPRRRRSAAHKRLNLPAPPFDLPPPDIPGTSRAAAIRRWHGRHGRKAALLYCEALKMIKGRARSDPDIDLFEAYPCRLGDTPGDNRQFRPLHWHAGHRAC